MRRIGTTVVMAVLTVVVAGCGTPGGGTGPVPRDAGASGGASPGARVPRTELSLELEPYDGGYFTLLKPVGWEIVTGGAYGGFGYMMWDPDNPSRRIVYIGEIVPFYASAQQKEIDRQYMAASGFPVEWHDMPVVSPLTPLELFRNFGGIVASQAAQAYMPGLPPLNGFDAVSVTPASSALPIGQTDIIHATFLDGAAPCQGQFMATVAEFMPFVNGPGGGTGIAGMVVGVMAPVPEFPELHDDLLAALGSFQFSEAYVQEGLAQGRENFAGIMRAGQTLRETSEMVARSYQASEPSSDIALQQWSDAMLGNERVYDPDTNDVYEVPNGFYDTYDLDRGRYDMNNLQQLPAGDVGLWTTAPLSGDRIR